MLHVTTVHISNESICLQTFIVCQSYVGGHTLKSHTKRSYSKDVHAKYGNTLLLYINYAKYITPAFFLQKMTKLHYPSIGCAMNEQEKEGSLGHLMKQSKGQ